MGEEERKGAWEGKPCDRKVVNGMPRGNGTGPPGGSGPGTGRGMGKGRGKGSGRGAGPVGQCICPSCGTVSPHQAGVPCSQVQCPKCGTAMMRK